MSRISYMILIAIAFVFLSYCSSSKFSKNNACQKQYTYRSHKIDIKGITAKLKKEGVDIADIGVSEITIDPKNVIASDKLQELDLYQFSLCQQLNSLSQKDTATISLRKKYIEVLLDMLKVAQNK